MDDDATYDWRITLQPDDRQRFVNIIMETFKRHLPVSGPEGLVELRKNATRFEENIYMASTSQSDYLRKLSMKILTIETIPQTTGISNTIQSNFAASAQIPPASASHSMPSQMLNQWLSQIPLPNQPQAPQQLFSQNLQNAGIQSSCRLPPVTSLTQTSVRNAAGQSNNMQSRVEHNSVGSSVSQGLPPNIFLNSQLYQQQQLQNQMLSSSIASTAQTGHNAVDWQEEIYQKIKSMKELYLSDLNDMYQKLSIKCQQNEQNERLKLFLKMLERNIRFLNGSKNDIVPALKEKLPVYEKHIIGILKSNRPRQPVSAQQEIQQPDGGHQLFMHPQQPHEQHQQIPQLQQQQHQEKQQPLLPISLPKTITPTNVVYLASLSTPLLEKDLEKQSLVTTAATPGAPDTNQKLIYFLMFCILFLDFIAYCLIRFWDS